MAKTKSSVVKAISDCIKQAQIYEQAFQRLEAIPSTDLNAKRSTLEQWEISLSQVSAQADSARERVAALRESLTESAYSNGADAAEVALPD